MRESEEIHKRYLLKKARLDQIERLQAILLQEQIIALRIARGAGPRPKRFVPAFPRLRRL